MPRKTRTITTMKCPNCGSKPSKIMEIWGGYGQTYEVDDKGNVVFSLIDCSMDFLGLFEAYCSNPECKKIWRLKNVKDIVEIDHYVEHRKTEQFSGFYYLEEDKKLYK